MCILISGIRKGLAIHIFVIILGSPGKLRALPRPVPYHMLTVSVGNELRQ